MIYHSKLLCLTRQAAQHQEHPKPPQEMVQTFSLEAKSAVENQVARSESSKEAARKEEGEPEVVMGTV